MRNAFIMGFMLFVASVSAQTHLMDSLKREISKANDTTKIRLLNDLSIEYWDVDYEKSINIANQALKLADKCKYYRLKAQTYNIIGGAYARPNNFEKADEYYTKSLATSKVYGREQDRMNSWYNKVGLFCQGYKNGKDLPSILNQIKELSENRKDYTLFIQSCLSILDVQYLNKDNSVDVVKYVSGLEKSADKDLKIAINTIFVSDYFRNGQYFKAIETIKESLKQTKDDEKRYWFYMKLGDIYFTLDRSKESLNYYQETLRIMRKSTNEDITAYLPTVEYKMGSLLNDIGDYKSSYQYLIKVLEVFKYGDFSHDSHLGLTYSELAKACLGLDSLKKADYFISKSSAIFNDIRDTIQLVSVLDLKFKLQKKQGQTENIKATVKQIEETIQHAGENYIFEESYQLLSEYYKSINDYKQSLHYFGKLVEANDTIRSKQSVQSLDEFQVKYETEKKEQQIKLQEADIRVYIS